MFNIDVTVFVAFLALNLIVGLRYGRNVKNIGDYALGGRNFTTGALVATIVATWIGGGSFFIPLSKTYSEGLYYVIASKGMVICFFIVAYVFVPRMAAFLGKLSVAEVMGSLYGQKVRVITAVAGTIGAAGAIAVQFKAFGSVFAQFLEFPPTYAIISAGVIVTLYSAFGGVRSVTFTDILQFCAFGVSIPIIGIIIWEKLYGLPDFSITKALEDPKFDLSVVLNFGNVHFWQTVPLFLYYALPGFNPAFFQRILIGKNIVQIKKAFIVSAFIILAVQLLISWIPFLIYNVDSSLNPNSLLAYIVKHYAYQGLKGFTVVAVVAMAMSTADSFINASSVLFAHDMLSPFNIKKNRELIFAKIFSVFLGGGSIVLALYSKDFLEMVLTSNSFYIPIVTVPLMASILGFRTSSFCVLTGMGAGLATVVAWKIKGIEMDCIVIAMCVNFVTLTVSHYLTGAEGGWVARVKLPKEEGAGLLERIKNFDPVEFFRSAAPKNDFSYSGLGIFCILFTFSAMYSTHPELLTGRNVTALYQIMLCTGLVLAAYPMWPSAMRYEIIARAAWHSAIFYMLNFFGAFFLMLSGMSGLQFALFTINTLLTIVLAGWKIGSFLIAAGFYCALKFHGYYTGEGESDFSLGSPEFVALYVLAVVAASVLIFLRPREEEYSRSEGRVEHFKEMLRIAGDPVAKAKGIREEFIKNIQHETNNPLTGITSLAETLCESYGKLKEKDIIDGLRTILASSVRLETFAGNLINLSNLVNGRAEISKTVTDLSALLTNRVGVCKRLHGATEDQKFTLDIEKGVIMECDPNYLACAFDNLILNAITYCKKGEIMVALKRSESLIEISIGDDGYGVPEKELSAIFDSFEVSSKTWTPAGGRGIGLSLAKSVVEFHGGTIKAESDGKKGAKFTISFKA